MNSIKKFIAWYRRPKSKTADFFESLIVILPLAFLIRTVGFGLYKVPTGSMETTMLTGEAYFADKFTPLFGNLKHGDIITFNEPWFEYSKNPLLNWWQMYAWGPVNITKRIIGLPADHIQGKIEDGKPVVYRNGQKLDEPYLNTLPIILTANPDRPKAQQISHKTYVPGLPLDKQPYYHINEKDVALAKRLIQGTQEPLIRYPGTPNLDKGKRGGREGLPFDEFDVYLGPDEYWMMGDNRQGSYDSRGWGPLKRTFIHGKIVFRIWSHDDNDTSWMIFDLLLQPIDFWKRVRWHRCLNLVK